jgi:hypothetical protein
MKEESKFPIKYGIETNKTLKKNPGFSKSIAYCIEPLRKYNNKY